MREEPVVYTKKEKIKLVAGCVCIIVACAFLFVFAISTMDHVKGKKEYDKVRDMAVTEDGGEEEESKKEKEKKMLVVDWDALYAENSNYAGWLEMEPGISYPVVKGTDNSFYLNRGFTKEYNINGSIFMHCDCDAAWTSFNTVLYGHNMIDGAMFGSLKRYGDEAFLRENERICIHVKGGRRVYKVFSCIYTQDMTEPYHVLFLTDEEKAAFIRTIKGMSSLWIEENAPEQDDLILTLSTCVGNLGSSKRQVVQAKYVGFEPYDSGAAYAGD